MERLAVNARRCQILLRIDNRTAISYVNKMGGIKYSKYNALSKKIWQWAEERHVFLFATYIASKDNVKADALSRIKNIDTEWKLNNGAFEKIASKFGSPQVDLFAKGENTKCQQFFARFPEPGALEVDAFTVDWPSLNFYAFPPIALILIKVLVKIKKDKARGY